ncbi:MAG: hypothetical protein QOG43_1620, partial [Actinomycetota bacterium]|nr:hypothetical protein [Actinomycetota bacterium]
RSAAHQLARRTGTSVVQAAAVIDTARGLGALPATAAAARRGELSAEQASAIVDAAGADGGVEQELLEAARRVPLGELRQQCARTKAAAQVDAEARRRRIHQRRSLRSFTDAEGVWHLHCRNNPEVGARIMAALDSFREAIFRQARGEGRHEPSEAYAADALTEMARHSTGTLDGARDNAVGPAEAPRTIANAEPGTGAEAGPTAPGDATDGTTVNAGATTAGEATAGAGGAGEATAGATVGEAAERPASPLRPPAPARAVGGRPKIIVRVDLETLLRGYATEGEVCEIAGFGPVAVSAVRDMIASEDPFLTAVVTKGQKLVGVAHLGRRPNAVQQTALQWLYPSCANQACSARARLDYDHRLDWSRTHFTVLDLLDRLCPHCHALKTRKNWSLVEGRGQRALVPPEDRRHPRHAVDPRVNGPPGR